MSKNTKTVVENNLVNNTKNTMKKKYELHKLMYSRIDAKYEEIMEKAKKNKEDKKAQFMKEWIDNNWKSIQDAMAEQMYEMAESTWEYSMTESDKEEYGEE